MSLQLVNVPTPDGTIHQVGIENLGVQGKQLLSLVCHLNYVRLGYFNRLPFKPVGVSLFGYDGDEIASFAVANVPELDLHDFLKIVCDDWDVAYLSMARDNQANETAHTGTIWRLSATEHHLAIEQPASCEVMGICRMPFFRQLKNRAKREFQFTHIDRRAGIDSAA
jgi:hypothetical protein